MKGFDFLVDSKIARISTMYALQEDISIDSAMAIFINSKTYQLLNDKETGVCLEVSECVYDMFVEEMEADISEE